MQAFIRRERAPIKKILLSYFQNIPLSYGQVLNLLQSNAEFRDDFFDVLRKGLQVTLLQSPKLQMTVHKLKFWANPRLFLLIFIF